MKKDIWSGAEWIWGEQKYINNEYVDFKLSFEIAEPDSDANLYLCADSEYVLWINGNFVSCGNYHDYPDRKHYNRLKVGQYLKTGKNELLINGYYQGISTMQYAVGERGLGFCLHNRHQRVISSKNVMYRLSQTYRSGDMFMITSQLGFSFAYDARGENSNKKWKHACELHPVEVCRERPIDKILIKDVSPVRIVAQGFFFRNEESESLVSNRMYNDYLSHRRFEELFEGEKEFPIKIREKNASGVYIIIDLLKETAGYLSMRLSASEGTKIDIAYGEHLQDLRVRCKIGERNFAASYICKEGRQHFQALFKRIGARYLQLHIYDYEYLELMQCGLMAAEYPIRLAVDFSSENRHRQRLFSTCIHSLKLCMHEHYEDCPWREQALYSFDSRNQALYGYYVFREYRFARASIDLLGQIIDRNGQLNICAPTDNELKIPSFSLWWLVEMWEYADHSKDDSLLQEYWGQIKCMTDCVMNSGKGGRVNPPLGENYWHFYEWSNMYDGYDTKMTEEYGNPEFTDGVYIVIAYIVLDSVLKMAKHLKDTEYVKKIESKRKSIRLFYNRFFWNEENGMYASYKNEYGLFHYGEFVQAMALYSKICNSSRQRIIFSKLYNNEVEQKITLGFAIFKYEAMIRIHPEKAMSIYRKIEDLWSTMLYQNATSFWETIKGESDFDLAGSMCHGWSSLPVYFYYRYVKNQKNKN